MDKLSEQVILIILASVFLLIVAVGIILLVFIYQKRQILYITEKEQIRVDFENQILESKLEIQEQTFKNISQEIHDNIGQVLSLAKLTINTMHKADPELISEKIEASKDLVSKAIRDLRNLSKRLHTDYVADMGLQQSVEFELELVQKATSIQARCSTEGESFRLDPKQELILFRIFQEVIQNIIKHSGSSSIEVRFMYSPGRFRLSITDDGKGFDRSNISGNQKQGEKAGIGLRNMENRAKLIAAKFNLESQPGKGTKVEIELPLPEQIV